MFDLTGRPLLALCIAFAVLAVIGTALLAGRRAPVSRAQRIVRRAVPIAVLAVLAQGFAVGGVALAINNYYGFYTSWSDLTGTSTADVPIATNGLLQQGQGTLQVHTVVRHRVGRDDTLMVWLPPQYNDPAYKHHRFPVVMFLPGQPSSPQIAFREFDFGATAANAISSHSTPPFIAVFPTLMIDPPTDTECTNIAHGPQAETWLTTVVPQYLAQHYRVQPQGRDWSAIGWSTGGFCSAKMVTGHPRLFGSAVSFGGYYNPLYPHMLFHGRRGIRNENSPQWLYQHGGLGVSRLLIVAGRQDIESWPSTQLMLRATAGDPRVNSIVFPTGGHNYRNYANYLPTALHWVAASWHA